MATEKEQPKFKILTFPWLAHGHIFPFLELSKKLSTSNYFTIYICSTAVNLDSIRASLEKDLSDYDDASLKLVELQMPSSPELPPELHTTKNLPSNLIPKLLQAFQMSRFSLSDIMNLLKPDLLIYDFFQPWAPKIASSRGVPSIYFSTQGAAPTSFYHHLYTMGAASTFPYKAINLLEDQMVDFRNYVMPFIEDGDDDFAFGNFTRSTDIVLVKSCRELEGKYIDYLSVLCKKQIVCTGPLIADANNYDDEENSEIMKWLSGKNQCSTIYISFGSECYLSKEQIAEIAKGLQLCNVNFLWVIRFPVGEKTTNIEEELPEGFVRSMKQRGLVVTRWAPQTKILAHPSIGGFVSHCGWSSVMESICFGVPVITMPMRFEQPANAQLVVEAGVGVEVEKGGNGHYVGEEVAKAINKVMVEKTFYEGMRNRAKILSEKIKEKEEHMVNEVAEHLLSICVKNKQQV